MNALCLDVRFLADCKKKQTVILFSDKQENPKINIIFHSQVNASHRHPPSMKKGKVNKPIVVNSVPWTITYFRYTFLFIGHWTRQLMHSMNFMSWKHCIITNTFHELLPSYFFFHALTAAYIWQATRNDNTRNTNQFFDKWNQIFSFYGFLIYLFIV